MFEQGCAVEYCARPAVIGHICAVCRTRLCDALDAMPGLAAGLNTVITRASVTGGTGGGGDDLPFAWDEADLLWVMGNTLRAWAYAVAPVNACPLLGRTEDAAAGWLRASMPRVLRSQHVGQLVDEIVWLATVCSRAVDNDSERVYAGPCDTCQRDLYARPDAAEVECRTCRLIYDVQGRRAWMLDQAMDRLLTAADMSRALTSLGAPVTPTSIRQWAARGKAGTRLVAHDVDRSGRPLYRVAEVLALRA